MKNCTTFLHDHLCVYLLSSSPGDKLCSLEDCIPGTGVYLRHGYIYSSLAGYVLRKNEGEEVSGVGRRVPQLSCCTTFVNVTEACSVPVM